MDKSTKAETLRIRAEELLRKKNSSINSQVPENDMLSQIDELQVHKLELELQFEELKQAYEQSEIASQKYTDLFNFAPIGYFTLSKCGTILDLNLVGAKMLGKDILLLKKARFGVFISEATKPVFNRFLSNLFSSRTYQTCEVIFTTDESLPIHVNLTGIVTIDRNQFLVTSTDITERIQMAQSIHAIAEKFQLFFEEDLTGNFMMNEAGILLDCNPAFIKMFGFEHKDEIIGKSITILYVDTAEFEFIKSKLNTKKILKDYETKRKRKDGKIIDIVENKVARFNANNEIIEIKGFIYDITERKQNETDLVLKNQQLEKLNTEKDKFFSLIAHDLRGPFNGFLGLSQIIAQELKTLESEEVQKMGETMWRSATNLDKLLENLLQWSQMEQGLIPYNPVFIPLLSFIEDNLANEFQNGENKGISTAINIPDNITVLADEKMLRSIVGNLYSNAIKFTFKGGKISISAKYIPGNQVEISIQDTGIGINKDQLNKLFRLNRQINRKGTDGELSTGLGLFLCKDFITKHGGTIWVESEIEKGSTFYFTIPGKV